MIAPTISFQRFWREVTEDGRKSCALKGAKVRVKGTDHAGHTIYRSVALDCDGPLDAHHFVPKRRLPSNEAKQDARNGVPLCRLHHNLVEARALESPRPELLNFFLAEHGITEPSRTVRAAEVDPDQ